MGREWLQKALLGWVLALSLGWGAVAENVHLFLPTDRHNPQAGRHDALRLEMSDVPLESLPGLIQRYSPVLPHFDAKHPPVVPIYLSRSTPLEERERIVEEGKRRLNEAFPGLKIRYSVRYLEDNGADQKAAQTAIVGTIEDVARTFPQDEATRRATEILKAATYALGEPESVRNTLPALSDPATARNIVGKAAWGKAIVSFLGRSTQLAQQGVSPEVAPVLASIALVGGDTTLNYLSTKYEVAISNFLSKHPLPIPIRDGVLKRVQEIYTSSQVATMLKGTVGTVAIYGMAIPTAMRTLGHFANPEAVSLPTVADVGHLALTSAISSATYFAGFQGFEKLRQKGWIHQPAIDLILRANGYLWLGNSLILSTGNPHAMALSPFIMGPMWTIYGTPALLAPLLPARNNRIVLLDPNLHNRADLNQLEALEATYRLPTLEARAHEEALRAATEARELKPSAVSRMAGRAAEKALAAGQACGNYFSHLFRRNRRGKANL